MKKIKAHAHQAVLCFLLSPLVLGSIGCATQSTRDGLKFSDGVSEEPQLQRAIARFCDSAYIAENQSQDMSTGEIVGRYKEMHSQRQKWTSGLQVAELTKASLVSNRSAQQIVRILIEMEGRLSKDVPAESVAELAKLAAITEWEVSVIASKYKQFAKVRKWNQGSSPIELTKVAVFADKTAERVLDTYDELKMRQGKSASERELTELTKVAILTGRNPNAVVKIYDQVANASQARLSRNRIAELAKIAVLTLSAPKAVVSRYHDIMGRKSMKLNTDRAIELTKISLLGQRSVDDVMKTYQALVSLKGMTEGSDQTNALTLNMLSGELLQDSVFGDNVDECNGAYARLFLSIDSYRSEES